MIKDVADKGRRRHTVSICVGWDPTAVIKEAWLVNGEGDLFDGLMLSKPSWPVHLKGWTPKDER